MLYEVITLVDAKLPNADVVVVSDYAKGVLTPALIAHIVKAGRAAGKIVISDTKATDWSAYRGASLLTPNAQELGAANGSTVASDADVATAVV